MAGLIHAIGDDAARLLVRQFGGTTLYVPLNIGEHHPIRVVIGSDASQKLIEWCGGSRLNVPQNFEKRAKVKELRQQGTLTISQIATETGYTERHVYRLLREDDDRQGDLFGCDNSQNAVNYPSLPNVSDV